MKGGDVTTQKRLMAIEVNLVDIIRQAAAQVFGSDEREMLYAWLLRNADAPQPIKIDLTYVLDPVWLRSGEVSEQVLDEKTVGAVRNLVKQAARAWENLDITQGELADGLIAALEAVEAVLGLDDSGADRDAPLGETCNYVTSGPVAGAPPRVWLVCPVCDGKGAVWTYPEDRPTWGGCPECQDEGGFWSVLTG